MTATEAELALPTAAEFLTALNLKIDPRRGPCFAWSQFRKIGDRYSGAKDGQLTLDELKQLWMDLMTFTHGDGDASDVDEIFRDGSKNGKISVNFVGKMVFRCTDN